ncbi:serine protease easter-like [Cimex lectularius]|uniref:CLIP domain-containing serine protease n=1 Tax=Cimex lectularius TaxID=79782 RepID=A0A8I6RP08_CIMLE|nr:serine protease easter-like [Cimex lectularius]
MLLFCKILFTVVFVFTARVVVCFQNTTKHGALVIEEEGDKTPRMIDMTSKQELLCSYGSSCVPLSECTIMTQLLRQSCLQMNKMRGLTCGYKGAEPLVCCPDSCSNEKDTDKNLYQEKCGLPQFNNWWSYKYQGVGSQPWAVRVGFKNVLANRIDYLCCGSIISKHVILTAAHCALAKTSTHKIAVVKVGEFDSEHDPDCNNGLCAPRSVDVPLNHIIVHPGYDAKVFRHNIALLVLKQPLNYSLGVQPICLYPKSTNYIYAGHRALLVGWGKLAGQKETRTKQQQLSLPVVKLESCSLVYGTAVPITENELCAGGELGRDACSGFGGAPLVTVDPNSRDRYFQIGLMSFGSDQCGSYGVPSVYTRVDRYTDWIIANSPKID